MDEPNKTRPIFWWALGGTAVLGLLYYRHNFSSAIGYVAGKATALKLRLVQDGKYLRSDAAKAAKALLAKASASGFHFTINSGFRTMAEQTKLWDAHATGASAVVAAKPGHSNHQGGLAMDLGGVNGFDSAAYKWLADNAPSFGFSGDEGKRVGEAWHWTYTGAKNV